MQNTAYKRKDYEAYDDVEELLRHLRDTKQTHSFAFRRALLFKWVSENTNGAGANFSKNTLDKETRHGRVLKELHSRFLEEFGDLWSEHRLDAFTNAKLKTYRKFRLSEHWVSEMIRVIPDLAAIQNTELQRSWFRIMGEINPPHRVRRIVAPGGKPTRYDATPYRGDYLTLQSFGTEGFTFGFLRFYEHRTHAARATWLAITRPGQRKYGLKGWINDHQTEVVGTLLPVKRELRGDIAHTGGIATLSLLKSEAEARVICHRGEVVLGVGLMSEHLHQTATTIAPMVLLRLKDFEHMGGTSLPKDKKSGRKRNIEMNDLQDKLNSAFARFSPKQSWCEMTGQDERNLSRLLEARNKSGKLLYPPSFNVLDMEDSFEPDKIFASRRRIVKS